MNPKSPTALVASTASPEGSGTIAKLPEPLADAGAVLDSVASYDSLKYLAVVIYGPGLVSMLKELPYAGADVEPIRVAILVQATLSVLSSNNQTLPL